ncbi:MAG: hypothetical protein KJ811_00055, partial [Candidatus Margulisbacteria bacterium]|nr:hypothetical protein [Candidatus Margulisiibacteriota bacterium]
MKKIFCYLFLLLLVLATSSGAREVFSSLRQSEPAQVARSTAAADIAYPMQTFQLKYLDAEELGVTIAHLLSAGETVAVSKKINTLIVRASQNTINRLLKIIDKLDTPPLQLQVEAKIIEVKTGSGDTANASVLGTNWNVKRTEDPNDRVQLLTTDTITAGATSLGLYAQLLSGNVDAYLSALEKSIGYDLVASPWITALNHEEAEILIGSKYGYRTSVITQTSTIQEVQYLEVGTKLRFTPHINEDGYIKMSIYPSVSEGQVVNELPQENTTETKNQVLVKDGQTIVIGGLTKNYNNQVEIGVPILSSIPILGNLF